VPGRPHASERLCRLQLAHVQPSNHATCLSAAAQLLNVCFCRRWWRYSSLHAVWTILRITSKSRQRPALLSTHPTSSTHSSTAASRTRLSIAMPVESSALRIWKLTCSRGVQWLPFRGYWSMAAMALLPCNALHRVGTSIGPISTAYACGTTLVLAAISTVITGHGAQPCATRPPSTSPSFSACCSLSERSMLAYSHKLAVEPPMCFT
jgi:hypothetical protein